MSYWDSSPAAKRFKTTASKYFSIGVRGYGSKMLQNMNRARLEERFCDFKIRVGEQIIHAHKIVLAEGCDYFRAMLSHPMKESIEGIVEMVDVDFECLEICVEYIYLGKIKVMKEKLQSLLKVAYRLQLNELCEKAVSKLEESLSLDTFFTIKKMAVSLDLKQLEKKCDDFASKNLHGIALQADFVKMDLKYLEFLMTEKVPSVIQCKVFLIWANYDPDNRGKKFEEFFLNLDLNQLPSSYPSFLEQNEALFFNSSKCMRKSSQSKLLTRSGEGIGVSDLRPYKAYTRFGVFDKTSEAIQAYDPDQDTWTELHKFRPEIGEKCTAIVVGEDIFVFAYGQRNWKLRYTDKNATWSALPNRSMTSEVKAVKVDGLIYAFCDFGVAVEVYDGSKWSHITDKPVAASQNYIVGVDYSIYCIGGEIGLDCCSRCNKYDTRKVCWSSLPPMPERRGFGSAVELDRRIYVIGGRYHDEVTETCLVFDIETEVWTRVASMRYPRYNFCSVPIAGKIFCIGGTQSRNTVEEFDPSTGKWMIVMTLSGKKIVATASVAL